jgi:hypothetical protein
MTIVSRSVELSDALWDGLGSAMSRFAILEASDCRLLIALLVGEPRVKIDTHVLIRNASALKVLFRCSPAIPDFDTVDFTFQLCQHSRANSIACHQNGVDLTLLDYVLAHRDDSDAKEQCIKVLKAVAAIASVVSSPIVVQRYVSLFLPLERRYIAVNHHLLLPPLNEMIRRAREVPSASMAISQSFAASVPYRGGLAFTCWLSPDATGPGNIVTICDEQGPLVSLGLTVDRAFAIDDSPVNVSPPLKRWGSLAITLSEEGILFFVDGALVVTAECRGGPVSASVMARVGGSGVDGRVANCGLFPCLTRSEIASIAKRGPRGSLDQFAPISSFSLAADSAKSESRAFADILLRSFKVEVLLPLLAQLDLTLRDGSPSHLHVLDVVSVLSSALSVSEREQFDFVTAHGFQIVSQLLLAASPRHVSHALYLAFITILETSMISVLRKALVRHIILKIELWVVCDTETQSFIFEHWARLFEREQVLFLEFMNFSELLTRLRVYYWYEPIEGVTIGADAGTPRPRPSDLDARACREKLFALMLEISKVSFVADDFALLIDHIVTTQEEKQCLDLLSFATMLASASHEPIRVAQNPFETLRRVHGILRGGSPSVIIAAFRLIVAVYRHSDITSCTLCEHAYICANAFLKGSARSTVLDGLCGLIRSQEGHELFMACSWLANMTDKMSLYHFLDPSERFVTHEFWAAPAIMRAVRRPPVDCALVFGFLARCSLGEAVRMFHMVRFAAKTHETDADPLSNRFLHMVCLSMLNHDSEVSPALATEIFDVIRFHLFVRDTPPRTLHSLFAESPWAESLDSTPARPAFGLRISADGEWLDANLAELLLQVVRQYRYPDAMRLALLGAAFLVPTGYNYVRAWVRQIQLTSAECEEHFDSLCFVIGRMHASGRPFPSEWDIQDPPLSIGHGFRHLESVAQSVDFSLADGYSELGKTYRKFRARAKKRGRTDFETLDALARAGETAQKLSKYLGSVGLASEKGMRRWQRLWSNLVVDQAPWDPSRISGNRLRPRWKRANLACADFCPWLVTRNYHFTDHKAASIARDIGSLRSAEEQLREYHQQAIAEMKANAPPPILQVGALRSPQRDAQSWESQTGRILAAFQCELIKVRRTRVGTFQVLKSEVRIVLARPCKLYSIEFNRLARVLLRRRFHLPTALEFFMATGESYFVNFPEASSHDVLRTLNLGDAVVVQKHDLGMFVQSQPFTQQWVTGELSNFEYLCHLNMFSGRSFNDSSQYPFFPWVIADYESDTLDLSRPETFRDLEKPIGAIDPTRLADLRARMAAMQQTKKARPYLYSSFVICSLAVYFYLLRMEPFATLHIEIQSGKFDHASRLFLDVAESYHLASAHLGDYRELIPEFYFQPEFLVNENEFDLGSTPKGGRVNDVVLPPWAHGSAPTFIYLMRKALESDYVSEHLSDWIDLFFGYKQTDQPAVNAANLYHPDMYESAWTKETLNDPGRSMEIRAVMTHVGTIPPKLFSQPHPRRVPPRPSSVLETVASVEIGISDVDLVSWNPATVDELVVLDKQEISVFATTLEPSPTLSKNASLSIGQDLRELHPFHGADAIGVTECGGLLVIGRSRTSGKWPELRNVTEISVYGEFSAVVSDDSTLNLFGPGLKFAIPFYGEPISCCAISPTFRIAVAGTFSGCLVYCSLLNGTKMRVINLGSDVRILRTCITRSWGFVLTNATQVVEGNLVHSIWVHNCNGMFIRKTQLNFALSAWTPITSKKGFEYLLLASEARRLHICEAFYLNIEEPFHRCSDRVISVIYRVDAGVAIAVLQSGTVLFIPLPL